MFKSLWLPVVLCSISCFFVIWSVEVNELEFPDEEEDRKVDWSEVKPTSVRAMTRRIGRLCQIIAHMDDTVAETLMYLIEDQGETLLDDMRVYCLGVRNLEQFIDEFTNLTVHYGKALLHRGPPKWIPAFFEPEATFGSFNWTRKELNLMYEMNEEAKKAYDSFSGKLREKMEKGE